MSEKLTVAELMARNAQDGARRADRPRRRRNLEDGGVSVSELTGSIPVVSDEDIDNDGADAAEGADVTGVTGAAEAASSAGGAPASVGAPAADRHPYRGGHVLDSAPAAPVAPGTSGVRDDDGDDAAAGTGVSDTVVAADVVDGEVVDSTDTETDASDEAPATTVLPRVQPTGVRSDVEHGADGADVADDGDGAAGPAVAATEGEPAVAGATGDTAEADADADKIIEYEDDAISWPALLGQTALAVVVGVVIFFGFTLLWDKLGTALVLIMAGIVTLVCVGVVHALLRHRHTLVLILAFIVGLVITLGPRLIMSI
ncbi:hypothetical protein [Corynebacterium sp.]|uniref:hypothetical protein n=1 Tax=Corynebacterium sp. TaxID=1720 RepID=UPI003B3BE224